MVCTNGFAKVVAESFAVHILCWNLSPAFRALKQVLSVGRMSYLIAVGLGLDELAVLINKPGLSGVCCRMERSASTLRARTDF